MPLVQFASLIQRHVHLSMSEVREVIDTMHIRHPELAIVTASDWARFMHSAAVTISPLRYKTSELMQFVNRGKHSKLTFATMFMLSHKNDLARRSAAARKIQRLWRSVALDFRMRRIRRHLNEEKQAVEDTLSKREEMKHIRMDISAKIIQDFWIRVTNSLSYDMRRSVADPSNVLCRVVPRHEVFQQPKSNLDIRTNPKCDIPATKKVLDQFDTTKKLTSPYLEKRWVEICIRNDDSHNFKLLVETESDFAAYELSHSLSKASNLTTEQSGVKFPVPLRRGWYNTTIVQNKNIATVQKQQQDAAIAAFTAGMSPRARNKFKKQRLRRYKSAQAALPSPMSKSFLGTHFQRRMLLHRLREQVTARWQALNQRHTPNNAKTQIQSQTNFVVRDPLVDRLNVPVATAVQRRYLVIDASGHLHIRKTATVTKDITRCVAAVNFLQKMCRGWRARQRAKRALEIQDQKAELCIPIQSCMNIMEQRSKEDNERQANKLNLDTSIIPEEVYMSPRSFSQVLDTHFSEMHMSVMEILFLVTTFMADVGMVSCTSFVKYVLRLIRVRAGDKATMTERILDGPFDICSMPELLSKKDRRCYSRRINVPESTLYAKVDDDGLHAAARILKSALRDPLQKFRYQPCRTSVQLPVNFRGIKDLQRSAKLPSFAPKISWVYGHSASSEHACRVVVTRHGDIVYPAGAMVVIASQKQEKSSKESHYGITKSNMSTKSGNSKKRLQQQHFLRHSSAVMCISIHPDGELIVTGQGGNIPHLIVWNSRTLKIASSHPDQKTQRFGFIPSSLDVSGRQTACAVHLNLNPARGTANIQYMVKDDDGMSMKEHLGLVPPPGQKPFYAGGGVVAAAFVGRRGELVVACGAAKGHRMGIWNWKTGQLLAFCQNTVQDSTSRINAVISMNDFVLLEKNYSKNKRSVTANMSTGSGIRDNGRVKWLTIGANHIKYWTFTVRYDKRKRALSRRRCKHKAGRKSKSRRRKKKIPEQKKKKKKNLKVR
jgi:Txe/YoeB family toxin of Txe-Axe toxin-antitoxin module